MTIAKTNVERTIITSRRRSILSASTEPFIPFQSGMSMMIEPTTVRTRISTMSLGRSFRGMRAGSLLVGDGRKTAEVPGRGAEDPLRDPLPAPEAGRGRGQAGPGVGPGSGIQGEPAPQPRRDRHDRAV